MSVDQSAPQMPAEAPALAARRLVRTALKGALATLDRDSGHPYASLVLVATEPDGSPIFLISKLARHTHNLEHDGRASLLVDGTDGLGDPLAGGRVTLTGMARPSASPTALRRFLARHPSAEGYAAFPDFAVYTLEMREAHYIGGFGRIVTLGAEALRTDVAEAQALIESEADILAHMNSDHADAVALYATVLANREPAAWRMCGIDPAGTDLLHRTNAARIEFPTPIRNARMARETLVALVQDARAQQEASRKT